jgi:hypothetical protein
VPQNASLPTTGQIVYRENMDPFDRLRAGGLVSVLPLIVVSLVCALGYWITKRGRTELTDSPWFWAFAFSAMGMLGVWAISGKYDDRQKRVEARYEARERVTASSQSGSAPADDSASPQAGYSSERRVPLHFLAVGLVIVSVVSLVMLCRAGRSTTSTSHADKVEPQSR